MKNITVFISSFLGRGHRWQLAALVALFFVAGCTVELYPPAQEVNNLPDGGKVDVLPDTIPRAFAFGPRIYWSQIVASDSSYSIAVTDANNKGRWLDSLRWVPSGPFVTVNGDTLSTRAYARDNSGVTGDNQVLTYNGSGSLTIESGNTVDMSDLLDNTDAQTIDTFLLSGNILSLSIESDGEAAKTVDLSGYLDNTDAQTIDTLTLQGDTMLQMSLSGDGAPVKELDLSALRSVIDSTRLTQDSILVYYQDGAEIGRDTIAGTGGGGADNLGDHTMTQNLVTNGNWISGDGGNEGIGVDAAGKVGVGTLTPSYAFDINSTDAIRLPVGTTAQNPTGATGLLRYNSDSTAFTGYYNAQWNRLIDLPYLQNNFWNTDGNDIWNSNSGNVGINTATPSAELEVNGDVKITGSATEQIKIEDASGRRWIWGVGNGLGGQARMQYYIGQNLRANMSLTNGFNFESYGSGGIVFDHPSSSSSDPVVINLRNRVGIGYNPSGYSDHLTIKENNIGNADADFIALLSETGNEVAVWADGGEIGIGITTPTALIHLKAGTATASTAPLKFTPGTNLTTPEAGAMEWDGTNLYITQTTGPTRKTIAYVDTDDGSASDTTDGSGDITVSHTLGSASITVTATATGTTFYHVQVHTKTSTTFKIRFFDAAGAAVTATAVTADWIAKLQ